MNISIPRSLLTALSRLLPPPRVIYDREGGSPYLSRWYLLGERAPAGEQNEKAESRSFNLFLHKFHKSDDDGALHNHPWRWAVALVLCGGYDEERRVGDEVVQHRVLPIRLNVIRGDDFHRVDLVEQDSWSLFVAGPRDDTWYFWDRNKKARSQWRDFIAAKRGYAEDANWKPDHGREA